MIFTTKISNKMLSSTPTPPAPHNSSMKPCKSWKCYTWRQFELQLFLVLLSLIVFGQAGVINKREIPLKIEATNASAETATVAEVTTTATDYTIGAITTPPNGPDIVKSELVGRETASSGVLLVESSTLGPITKLVMTSKEQNTEVSKEFVLNEIALNETRKATNSLDGKNLGNHLNDLKENTKENIKSEEENSKEISNSHSEKKEEEAEIKNTKVENARKSLESLEETSTKKGLISGSMEDSRNHIESHTESTNSNVKLKTNSENIEDFNENHKALEFTHKTNESEKSLTPIDSKIKTETSNDLKENHLQLYPKGIRFENETLSVIVQSTTPANIKDSSIESNHIMPSNGKEMEGTTESIKNVKDSTYQEHGQNSNKDASDILVKHEEKLWLSTTMPSNHADSLDRHGFKEISNDLPEKTTESYVLNKVEHEARSMRMEKETTVMPEVTTNLPLDHVKNSIDSEDFTHPAVGEKKPKFINDNSTNAQKLNLPSNAEVWTLAGMKPLVTPVGNNGTMETATTTTTNVVIAKKEDEEEVVEEKTKENENENENHKNHEFDSLVKSTTAANLDLNNSEKSLHDWSQIVMNLNFSSTVRSVESSNVDKNLIDNEHKSFPTTTPALTAITTEGLENLPSNDNNMNNLANFSTILSASSFDNIQQENANNNEHNFEVTSTLPAIINRAEDVTEMTTEHAIIPLTTLSSITNPELNEINLNVNKSLTNERVSVTTEPNSNHFSVNAPTSVTLHSPFAESSTMSTSAAAAAVEQSKLNSSNSEMFTTSTESTFTSTTATATSIASTAFSVVDSNSSEPPTIFSTLETVKVNASNNSEHNTNIDNDLTDKTERINNENNENQFVLNVKDKETLEVFATSTETNLPKITTYKPNYEKLELNPKATITVTPTPATATTNSKSQAEVDDQNGNEIENKKSINIETNEKLTITTTATTPTTTLPILAHLNISSTTIKTHLNEQVFETTTTTVDTTSTLTTTTVTPSPTTTTTTVTPFTATTIIQNNYIPTITTTESSNETFEKTTSSLAKDEIINGREEDFHLNENNLITTTPKTTTPTTSIVYTLLPSTVKTEHLAIGSSTIPPTDIKQNNEEEVLKKEKEQQQQTKLETTSESTTEKTPVVEQQRTTTEGAAAESSIKTTSNLETTTTTTTTSTTSSTETSTSTATTTIQPITTEVYQDTTTKFETHFKYPIHKGSSTENVTEETEHQTVEPIKNEQQQEIETTTETNMNIKTTTKYITEKDNSNKIETNESDNSITDHKATKTETDEEIEIQESTTTAKEQTTTSTAATTTTTSATLTTTTIPPPSTTAASGTTKESEIFTTEIDEISSSSKSSTERTQSTTEKQDARTEIPFIAHHTTPTSREEEKNNFKEEFTTTTTMLPTKIITANIGQGSNSNSMPPLITSGNSGNTMYPKNSDGTGETDVNVIIAITVSVIGVIALILLVAFLYLMRKRQKQTSYSQRCRPVSLDEYAIDNASVGGSMRKGSALRSSKRTYGNLAFDDPSLRHNPMGVHELSKFATEKLRIFEEFRDVPQITAREDEVPQGCEDKNRYANVLPLPESRVILQRLNDDDKSEYINANYVTGPKDTPNYYIACQAPLESTVEDFWRMIWEQQSRVIIQATDLIENGVEKCAEYLPPSVTLDNHSTFGDFQITLQNREVKDKYAISTLLLKHHGENVTRELTHYWYKWPETGVPVEEAPIIAMLLEARSSLISYAIEQANEDKEKKSSNATLKSAEEGTATAVVNNGGAVNGSAGINGNNDSNGEINGNISMVPLKKTARNQAPLTIHCSPGTGRTGTIIACDIAIRSLEAPKRIVDVPQIVYYVRRGRASAVLTKEQYEFIYKVANVYAAKISNPTTYN